MAGTLPYIMTILVSGLVLIGISEKKYWESVTMALAAASFIIASDVALTLYGVHG